MQTSRFQLGLMAAMAMGLGFSLASSEAVGYPAGAAISSGSNPVWSIGGDMAEGSHTVVTAESGDLIITDISMSSTRSGWWRMELERSGGGTLAEFSGDDPHARPLHRTLSSGLRLPQGESLSVTWGASYGGDPGYSYTMSGYYAKP